MHARHQCANLVCKLCCNFRDFLATPILDGHDAWQVVIDKFRNIVTLGLIARWRFNSVTAHRFREAALLLCLYHFRFKVFILMYDFYHQTFAIC